VRRRIFSTLAAAVAVAASISISAAGSAAAQPDTSAVSAADSRGGGGGATPITDPASPIFVDGTKFKIVATLRGSGSQVYTCGTDGKYALREPVATLQNLRGGSTVGIHGKGPFWASFDGSRVDRTVSDPPVAVGTAPGGMGNIDWLRVPVTPVKDAPGVFGNVQFVQRVDTRGGVAPATCTTPTLSVNYTTNYVFWAPK
jgi:hypothetical protein